MNLLAIDPGVTWCGVAVFNLATKRLIMAGRIKGKGFKGDIENLCVLARAVYQYATRTKTGEFHEFVFEWPQIYAGKQRGRKDPNDLLPLAALDALVLAQFAERGRPGSTRLYHPHDWKGSKHANATAKMVIDRLDPSEQFAVEDLPEFKQHLIESDREGTEVSHPVHNTLDAVGVGLKHLGRFERRRVIAR